MREPNLPRSPPSARTRLCKPSALRFSRPCGTENVGLGWRIWPEMSLRLRRLRMSGGAHDSRNQGEVRGVDSEDAGRSHGLVKVRIHPSKTHGNCERSSRLTRMTGSLAGGRPGRTPATLLGCLTLTGGKYRLPCPTAFRKRSAVARILESMPHHQARPSTVILSSA